MQGAGGVTGGGGVGVSQGCRVAGWLLRCRSVCACVVHTETLSSDCTCAVHTYTWPQTASNGARGERGRRHSHTRTHTHTHVQCPLPNLPIHRMTSSSHQFETKSYKCQPNTIALPFATTTTLVHPSHPPPFPPSTPGVAVAVAVCCSAGCAAVCWSHYP